MDYTTRAQIIEVINKLYVFTDEQNWEGLKEEVFAEELTMDMSSLTGTPAERMTAQQICEMWRTGFAGLDAVHHHSGNFLVNINSDSAKVQCYATATHFKESATKGQTRTYVGSYDFELIFKERWELISFKYNLKYMTGNPGLE